MFMPWRCCSQHLSLGHSPQQHFLSCQRQQPVNATAVSPATIADFTAFLIFAFIVLILLLRFNDANSIVFFCSKVGCPRNRISNRLSLGFSLTTAWARPKHHNQIDHLRRALARNTKRDKPLISRQERRIANPFPIIFSSPQKQQTAPFEAACRSRADTRKEKSRKHRTAWRPRPRRLQTNSYLPRSPSEGTLPAT